MTWGFFNTSEEFVLDMMDVKTNEYAFATIWYYLASLLGIFIAYRCMKRAVAMRTLVLIGSLCMIPFSLMLGWI